MKVTAERILRTYVTLTLLSTLASSFIWGINTLFLLDAGLTISQAFAANAFIGAESLYLLGAEKKGVPVRQALRRVGDLIRMAERGQAEG